MWFFKRQKVNWMANIIQRNVRGPYLIFQNSNHKYWCSPPLMEISFRQPDEMAEGTKKLCREYETMENISIFFRYDQTVNLMGGHFLAGAAAEKNFASNAQKRTRIILTKFIPTFCPKMCVKQTEQIYRHIKTMRRDISKTYN